MAGDFDDDDWDAAPVGIPQSNPLIEVADPEVVAEGRKRFDTMLAKLNKGRKQKILRASEMDTKLRVLPTGSFAFDNIAGIGGIPMRKTTRIYGPKSSGKSYMFYGAIATAQKRGLITAIVDTEGTLDDEFNHAWLAARGIDLDRLMILTGSAETVLDDLIAICQDPDAGYALIDSVDFLASDEQLSKTMEERTRANIALLMPEFLKKWNAKRVNCGLGLVQQIRANQDAANKYAPKHKTSGGFAIEHYVHLDIEVRGKRDKEEQDGERVDTGVISVFNVRKNKITGVYGQATVSVATDGTIDIFTEVIENAMDNNVLTKSGAWIYWDSNEIGKWNGQAKFIEYLEQNQEAFHELARQTFQR